MKLSPVTALKSSHRTRQIGTGASIAAAGLIVLTGLVTHVCFVAEYGQSKITTDLVTQLTHPPTIPPYYAQSVQVDYFFHVYVALAVLVGVALPALLLHLESSRKRLIDGALPRLFEDLAQGQEAGMTLLQALQETSKRDYGPVSEELKILVAKLTWGIAFEDAFRSFAERIGTDLTARVTVLLLEAVRLGGDLKASFRSTAAFVRKMIDMRNEREAQLRTYLIVIYVSTMVFMLVVVIIYQSLFLHMTPTSRGFMRLPLTLETYKGYLLDLAVVEAVIGGLAAGKLSEGRLLYGLKHSVLMLVAVLLVFTFFF